MFEIANKDEEYGRAKIKVIGLGGAGGNAVNTMIAEGLVDVEFIVANTDLQAIDANLAKSKIQLGLEITKGLGAGSNPEVGKNAAIEAQDEIVDKLKDADMVFITAGMGGGTGTGAAPVVADLAKQLGILTVGVVTRPFAFEGKRRSSQAEEGLEHLKNVVDSLVVVPNDKLLEVSDQKLSIIDAFKLADSVLHSAVRGISDLINKTGLINADFADICAIMRDKGLALMGSASAQGADRATIAAKEAISSPLLDNITIEGATGMIVNITAAENLTLHETKDAISLITKEADEHAEIIYGTVIDEEMPEDELKITVIATGIDETVSSHVPRNFENQVAQNSVPSVPVEKQEAPTKPSSSQELNSTSQEKELSRADIVDEISEFGFVEQAKKTKKGGAKKGFLGFIQKVMGDQSSSGSEDNMFE